MEATGIQVAFFQQVKTLLSPNRSLVDEVADLLDISNDSAYRRIRGEKPITLEEIQVLASHYQVSLDQFMNLKNESFLFSGKLINSSTHNFHSWTQTVLQQLQHACTFSHRHIIYLAKDIPLMQQFLVPEIACFKSFFWRKSILHYDEMKGKKFSLKELDSVHVDSAKKIVAAYNQIASSDIWNIESINSTIRQIEFYRESSLFESEADVKLLYKAVYKLIDHLEKQAELGLKFAVDGSPDPTSAPYNLYNNELILGDNTLLFELNKIKITFLNHSVINFIATRDDTFNNYVHETLQTIIRKSTQLSVSSEKERTRFFNRVRDKMKLVARL